MFIVGDPPYGDPQRHALLELLHPELSVLTRGLTGSERADVIEAWDRGRLGAVLLRGARAEEGRQAGRVQRNRAAARRQQGCQAYMLAAYERLGNREDVWDELIELLDRDPARRREILGADRPIMRETLRDYWKHIPAELRIAAKQRYLARPAAERNAELAGRRTDKLTG